MLDGQPAVMRVCVHGLQLGREFLSHHAASSNVVIDSKSSCERRAVESHARERYAGTCVAHNVLPGEYTVPNERV